MNVPFYRSTDPTFDIDLARLVDRVDEADRVHVHDTVQDILQSVRRRKDEAIVELTARFDRRPGFSAEDLEVPRAAWETAFSELEAGLRGALERAVQRVRAFHQAQASTLVDARWDDGSGLSATLRMRALDRVGIYVPGGTAPLFSSVWMNAMPAKVAGVGEVVMVTPAPDGVLHPAVLAAALLSGVDRLFAVGGAQAIAALAFGTERIPAVDKIVGPGNAWVQEAKRQVVGIVDIDAIAGPSEVLIVADAAARPEVVAADLLAQAEHDVRSAAVLVTWDEPLATAVSREVTRQLEDLPRKDEAEAAISSRGGIVLTTTPEEAFAVANRYAAEHLGLAVEDPESAVSKIRHAGAVFVGHSTPEALGDYNAGVNHVLPTGGTARFGSPLSVHDFVKRMSILNVGTQALDALGADAARLARAEGLEAHARAIELREAVAKE